jgi:hypothetical protein
MSGWDEGWIARHKQKSPFGDCASHVSLARADWQLKKMIRANITRSYVRIAMIYVGTSKSCPRHVTVPNALLARYDVRTVDPTNWAPYPSQAIVYSCSFFDRRVSPMPVGLGRRSDHLSMTDWRDWRDWRVGFSIALRKIPSDIFRVSVEIHTRYTRPTRYVRARDADGPTGLAE